jgi:phosphoribosylformimino-5-aminoimidazole carboxamide ribotide isomerase
MFRGAWLEMSKSPFQIIPVIDLLDGKVVHAVGGRRAYYQPIQSMLHTSSEPIPMARALRASLGFQSLYLADLDAIGGSPPCLQIYRELIAARFHLWIDAGVRDPEVVAPLLELDPVFTTIVAGLESLAGPRELSKVVAIAGADRVVFSLDLFEARPRLAQAADWGTDSSLELAHAAIDCGVQNLLILDLARVGSGRGLGSLDLINRIRDARPSVRLTAGGGISSIDDVFELRDAGANGVLIGSALHDGRIGARELELIRTSGQ